jgi:hypothetical protein
MTIEFHNTGYGRRFFDAQLPQLIDSIKSNTDAVYAAVSSINKLTESVDAFTTFIRDEITLTNVQVDGVTMSEYVAKEAHRIVNNALDRVK